MHLRHRVPFFEGRSAPTRQDLRKPPPYSKRLIASGRCSTSTFRGRSTEIEAAKYEVMRANDLTDGLMLGAASRGAGPARIWACPRPATWCVSLHSLWAWGRLLRRAKMKGWRSSRHRRNGSGPAPKPSPAMPSRRSLHYLHHCPSTRPRPRASPDALFMDFRGYVAEATGRQHLTSSRTARGHAPSRLLPERHHPRPCIGIAGRTARSRSTSAHHARGTVKGSEQMLADRHRPPM